MSIARKATALAAATTVAAVLAATPAHAASPNYIYNDGAITKVGMGVIHLWPGSGNYDAVLPADNSTVAYFGWANAEGFYIGSGYCAQIRRLPVGSTGSWTRLSDIQGPYKYHANIDYEYDVSSYKAASSSSCV